MIDATAKLSLKERTILIRCAVAPDNVHIASAYQDFLDKFPGPISADVRVVQDRDSTGAILSPGHATIYFSLKDAGEVGILDSDVVPVVSAPSVGEFPPAPSVASGSGSDGLDEVSPNLSPSSSLRTQLAEGEAKPPQITSSALMDEFKAMMAVKGTDKTLIKL